MRRAIAALLLAAVLFTVPAARAEWSPDEMARYILAQRSILTLTAYDEQNRPLRSAAGFSCGRRVLVTTFRLMENARWIMAAGPAQDLYMVPYVAAADRQKNIAILMFLSPTDLVSLAEAKSTPKAGDKASSYHGGSLVTGTVRELYQENGASMIRFAAPSPVDEGAPLLNGRGEVTGFIAGEAREGAYPAVAFAQVNALWEATEDEPAVSLPAWFGKTVQEGTLTYPIPKPEFVASLKTAPAPGVTATPRVTAAPGITAAPGEKPQPPQNVKASWGGEGVKVTWDEVPGAEKYRVYYSDVANTRFSLAGTSEKPEYWDTKTDYTGGYYQVRAVLNAGMTEPSETVEVSPKYKESKDVPVPKGLKTKVAAQGVTLSWGAVKGVYRYVVLRSDTKDGLYQRLGTVAQTQYTDATAIRGRTYYYKVRVIKDGALSSPSAVLTVKMPAPTAAPKPTPTPYPEKGYYVQVGKSADWEKYKGYWRVNPLVANGGVKTTVDGFTLTYYCEDILGNVIENADTGEIYAHFQYKKTIAPQKTVQPGFAWLNGYEGAMYIYVAVTSIHTKDGRTIDYPQEDWDFKVISLE